MRIDSHQHFWEYDPVRDDWITEEMAVIKRNFMPDDLQQLLVAANFEGCVAVQADQSEQETMFLLELARQYPFIKAVVGWVDLLANDLTTNIEQYVTDQSFKGVRHILQAEPDGFMTSPQFINGLKEIHRRDLSYDILTTEAQLSELLELVELLPEMRLVIDHISKPNIREQSFAHWAKYMEKISQHENVHVKLSGLATEADWANWDANDFQPYVDFCLDKFGPDRLMYGSDWPVCLLAGDYPTILDAIAGNLYQLSESEQAQIFGKTAEKFYQIE